MINNPKYKKGDSVMYGKTHWVVECVNKPNGVGIYSYDLEQVINGGCRKAYLVRESKIKPSKK